MDVTPAFWKNKKVLVTGHTGFKGSWLALWLQQMQADVIGLSLDPPTTPSLYEEAKVGREMKSLRGDIRDLKTVVDIFKKHQPEVVLHLAAQSLVRKSYQEPVETYATNVMGTLHVLEGIRAVDSVRSAVLVTTDKCYENKETGQAYKESDPMGGHDPYSSSKGCAEILISSYRNSFFPSEKTKEHNTPIASARAGNVIGGGDWATDRLIPDILRGFQAGEKVVIRNPQAIRPWQHVLEPVAGYLVLAQALTEQKSLFAEGWNFGPEPDDAKPVEVIVKKMAELWGKEASWSLTKTRQPHEATYLRLDCTKAREKLGWKPKWDLNTALEKIVHWHRAHAGGESARELCLQNISDYLNAGPQ
jgi:CDP-glucose 4,6-dehydratase